MNKLILKLKKSFIGDFVRFCKRLYCLIKVERFLLLNYFTSNNTSDCSSSSLRCEDNKKSKDYGYCLLGKNIPKCCASHLVELMYFVDDIFKKNGLEYLIVYGTFLGAVRHKGLIPWDTDIDLAISEESFDDVISVLDKEVKDSSYEISYSEEEGVIRLYFSKTNRLHIDFYVTHTEGEYYCIKGMKNMWKIPTKSIFPLKNYKFYNRMLPGPQNIEMLTMCYGSDVLDKAYSQWSLLERKSVISDFKAADVYTHLK